MDVLASTSNLRRVFAISVLARLPLATLSIALLVHTRHLTGSFAAAGGVDGSYALALAFGGPWLGRLADRRGQTAVLTASALVCGGLLGVAAALPSGAPVALIMVLALGIGASMPPLGACVRALFPGLVEDPEALRRVYAVDATAVELTWVTGPPLALALGSAVSTAGAVLGVAAVVVGGTLAFAAQPASRRWRAEPLEASRTRAGALVSPALRTLVAALLAVGTVFGAVQVGVAAAASALGDGGLAGPLLGLWGAGSLLGGILAVRLGGGARSAAGLSLVLAALALGHLSLTLAAGSAIALGALLLLAGGSIAPTYASMYAMAEHAAPAGTATEAFAWLTTAAAAGSAVGAAIGGALADGAGPAAAFAFAGAAGLVAVLTTALRAATLGTRRAAAAAAGC